MDTTRGGRIGRVPAAGTTAGGWTGPATADSATSAGAGGLGHAVCSFWVGPRCYAFDIALVGEVVNVDQILEVPLAPPGVIGLFSLRGTPVALLDLTVILELSDQVARREGRAASALVLTGPTGVVGAILVDRVEGVVPAGRGVYTPREWTHEHPAVRGFLETEVRQPVFITVLDETELSSRLERLKHHH